MIEVGARRRSQPAPPHVVFAALAQPQRAAGRPWLRLLDDDHPPRVVEVEEPVPDASLLGHLRKRLDELVNADLRYSFGQ